MTMRLGKQTVHTLARIVRNYFFKTRFHFSRFQLDFFSFVLLGIGIGVGSYLILGHVIPLTWAVNGSPKTVDTDTQFGYGTTSSTTVSGSGTSAYVALTPSGPNSTIYKKTVTVNNGSNSNTLTDYQVKIDTDTATPIAAGHMNSDCSDIRFRDNNDSTSITNYWLEPGTCNSSHTYIWVKIPSITGSSSTYSIYMYYGNSSLTTQSSVANTFIREISNVAAAWNLEDCTGTSIADSATTSNASTGTISIGGGGTQTTTGSCGTTNTAAAWYNGATGKYGSNLNLDGTDDYVNFPTHSNFPTGTSAKTMCMWAKPSTVAAGYAWAFAYGTAGNNTSFFIGRNGSQLDVGGYGGGNDLTSNSFWAAGTWAHVCNVFDGTTAYVYGNGSLITSAAKSWNTGTTAFYLGRQTNNGEYWGGMVDHVRLYSAALSAAEVADEASTSYTSYITTNYSGKELIRKYSSPEPSISIGSEASALPSSGTWTSAVGTDSNVIDLVYNGGWGDGSTGSSTAFSATVASVTSSNKITFAMRSASTTSGLSSASYVDIGEATSGTTLTITKTTMDGYTGIGTGSNRYIQVRATYARGTTSVSPQLDSFSITYVPDTTVPTNPSTLTMSRSSSGTSVSSNDWTNGSSPYFSWGSGTDAHSGIQGYCLYLGTDSSQDPVSSDGLLLTSATPATPVNMSSACPFFTTSTSISLTSGYQESPWLTTSASSYYLNLKTVDNNGNVSSSSKQFQFRYDSGSPTNTTYISCSSGSFGNVSDMNFSWPTSGGSASSDSISDVLGWQYQLDSSSGTWQGTTRSTPLSLDYIPATASAYTLVSSRDAAAGTNGTHTIYFRTVDNAGNTSDTTTYRTCPLSFGGAAPTFPGDGAVTVTAETPKNGISSKSETNSFSLSWPAASPTSGRTVSKYYYMVGTTPPSSYTTLSGTPGTYISSTSNSVSYTELANAVHGDNTVYVVAVDDASNYSSSNVISGTFNLDSTYPDPPKNLSVSDASIKASSVWRGALSWSIPTYKGTGSGKLSYIIQRSTNGTSWSTVTTQTGTGYTDNGLSDSGVYYWRVATVDDSAASIASPSYSSAVSVNAKGTYSTAAGLNSGPSVSSITTKTAVVTWSTDRTSDSRVAYGTKSGSYNSVEAASSTQVTSHSVALSGLTAGTTYYYVVKWTDEDGNVGTSSEKTFTTVPAPTASSVKATNIGLSSAVVNFTVENAYKVDVEYGLSTSYGGTSTVVAAGSTATYSVPLSNLSDGRQYHYHLVMYDGDGNKYVSDDYTDLVTLPRPRISNIRIQQVVKTAQSTVLVSWESNTEISSIITYYPASSPQFSRDKVDISLVKGKHQMILSGLDPETQYKMVVKGRDKVGNEADSDVQQFTTATDTTPPTVVGLQIEGTIQNLAANSGGNNAQLVISWNTDKPSTSQVQFSQGTGSSYSEKTQEDSNLTVNHLVVISNLAPSTVYHLQAISKDKYNNVGNSIDYVTITPKETANALNLVVNSLQDAFGFLGGIRR